MLRHSRNKINCITFSNENHWSLVVISAMLPSIRRRHCILRGEYTIVQCTQETFMFLPFRNECGMKIWSRSDLNEIKLERPCNM